MGSPRGHREERQLPGEADIEVLPPGSGHPTPELWIWIPVDARARETRLPRAAVARTKGFTWVAAGKQISVVPSYM